MVPRYSDFSNYHKREPAPAETTAGRDYRLQEQGETGTQEIDEANTHPRAVCSRLWRVPPKATRRAIIPTGGAIVVWLRVAACVWGQSGREIDPDYRISRILVKRFANNFVEAMLLAGNPAGIPLQLVGEWRKKKPGVLAPGERLRLVRFRNSCGLGGPPGDAVWRLDLGLFAAVAVLHQIGVFGRVVVETVQDGDRPETVFAEE